jgi:hypothetical protein
LSKADSKPIKTSQSSDLIPFYYNMIPTSKRPTATGGSPGNMNESFKKVITPKIKTTQGLPLPRDHLPPSFAKYLGPITMPSTTITAASEHPPFFRNMPGSKFAKRAFSNPRFLLLGAVCIAGYSLFSMNSNISELEKKVEELEKVPREQARMWREIDHLLVEQRRGNLFVTATPKGGRRWFWK